MHEARCRHGAVPGKAGGANRQAGGLQRIGLSATCTPMSTAAQFLCGVGRPCRIVRVDDSSDMDLRVEPLAYDAGPGFLQRLLARLEGPLSGNRTTLVFTN